MCVPDDVLERDQGDGRPGVSDWLLPDDGGDIAGICTGWKGLVWEEGEQR